MRIGAPAEFALVAACAVWPPSERRNEAIRTAAEAPLDWTRFLRVVHRHRIGGLVRNGLSAAGVPQPTDIASLLESQATAIARRSVVMARESVRLQTLLDAAGLPNLVLKGAALGALAYQNQPVKTAWDIDLVTTPTAVEAAMAVLESAGYELRSPAPPLTGRRLRTFVALGREAIFARSDGRVFVELKWALDQNPRVLPGISALSAPQTVTLGDGASLRTLGKDPLFAYLCVHGVRHGYSRLKWLADIAALLAPEPPEEIERLYRAALDLGAHRSAGVTLLLCERVLGLTPPPTLSAGLARDPAARALASVAMATLCGGDGQAELAERPFAGACLVLSHVLIPRDASTVLAEAKLKWVSVRDRMDAPLPGWAGFLYPIIRVPRSAWRRIRNMAAARHRFGRSSTG